MKILITSDWYLYTVNGVVTSFKNLMNELEKAGHEVRIVSLANTLSSTRENNDILIGSIDVQVIYPGARLRVRSIKKAIDEMVAWKPDVVHSQCEFSTFGIARRIAKKTGAPLIHTYHTVYEDYTHYFCPSKKLGRALVTVFTRYIAKRCDTVVVPTDKVANLLKSYKVKSKIAVIPTGIVIDKFQTDTAKSNATIIRKDLGYDDDTLILAAIGRLAKEKNTVEIIKMVSEAKDGVRLLIVGDGPYRGTIEEKVKHYGVEDMTDMTGMISPDKVQDYYNAGDVFVCASTSETQGLTYVEALASGTPLLCKKDDCLDGLIIDGVNGWQYTSEDDFKEKVEILKNMTKEQRKAMSDASIAIAEKYSSRQFAKNALALYEEAINGTV